jgi:hypothetical protein
MSNVAKRLYDILVRSKGLVGSRNMVAGWREVLSLPAEFDDLRVMSKVGKVIAMPHLLEIQIRNIPNIEHDLYLGWQADLSKAFKRIGFRHDFNEFAQQISESLLVNIRFCVAELTKNGFDRKCSLDDLEAIRQDLYALYERVAGAEMPISISSYLLNLIYRVIEAVDDFQITGSEGLQQALNEAIGSVVTSHETAKQAVNTPEGKDFWDTLGKVRMVLALAKSAAELAQDVGKLLGMGGNAQ